MSDVKQNKRKQRVSNWNFYWTGRFKVTIHMKMLDEKKKSSPYSLDFQWRKPKILIAQKCSVHNFHWMMYAPIIEILGLHETRRKFIFHFLSTNESKEENSYFFLFVCVLWHSAAHSAYHFPHFFLLSFICEKGGVTGKIWTNGNPSFHCDKK